MEAFLLIPESEWKQIVSRLERLEEAEQQRVKEEAALPADEILNVRQAAALLKVTPAGLRRARRAGRVKGVRINEKEAFTPLSYTAIRIDITDLIEWA